MKLYALFLLGILLGRPIVADVAPVGIFGPVILMIVGPALIVIAAAVLFEALKKKKKAQTREEKRPKDEDQN